jgi:probable F420-dependent oxidoreductase
MPISKIKFSVGDYVNYDKEAMPLTEFALLAEKLGFDGLSIGDHCAGWGPSHEPLTVMTWVAALTKRLIVSTSVFVLPLANPIRLAKQLANLDVLSNGRVAFGVGPGGENSKEFAAFDIPVNERSSRTDEFIEIMKGLWTEPSFSYKGRYLSCEGISFDPKPVQKPHLPIWIGGRLGGSYVGPDGTRMYKSKTAATRRAAKYGDGWLPYLMTPEMYKESVEMIKVSAKELGTENRPMEYLHNVSFVVRDSLDDALKVMRGPGEGAGGRYGQERGDDFTLRYDIVGSPRDCINRITDFIDAGVTHFILKLPTPASERREQMERLAKEVMPAFR